MQTHLNQCFSTCNEAGQFVLEAAKESVSYKNLSEQFSLAIKGNEIPFMVGTGVLTTVLYSVLNGNDKSKSICKRGYNKCATLAASLLIAGGATTLAVVNQEAIKEAAKEVYRQVMTHMPSDAQIRQAVTKAGQTIMNNMHSRAFSKENLPLTTIGIIGMVGVVLLANEAIGVGNEKNKKRREL